MIPKRELTQEQTEEIQALWGRLPADEVKKRFGIGSSRLYKIWRDETAAQKALPRPLRRPRYTGRRPRYRERPAPHRPPSAGAPRRLAPRRNPDRQRLLQSAGGP